MRRMGVVLAIAGLAAHLVVSLVLVFVVITSAYTFADSIPGAGDVSSYDQLPLLGDSPRIGFLFLWSLGLLDVGFTVLLLLLPRTGGLAWIVPLVAIGLSIVVCVLTIAGFEVPPPPTGG